ncbi:MAG: hypothetical protein ACK587_00730 [Cyanobacteriota bacterium]
MIHSVETKAANVHDITPAPELLEVRRPWFRRMPETRALRSDLRCNAKKSTSGLLGSPPALRGLAHGFLQKLLARERTSLNSIFVLKIRKPGKVSPGAQCFHISTARAENRDANRND